jgi:cytochrome c-type biogenesis protein CcmH/NrfG
VSEGRARALSPAVVPLLVGALLGFIVGYFAGGGRRPAPSSASAETETKSASGDRFRQLRQALDRDPENPKLWTSLGNAYYDTDDWDHAIEAYEKARRRAASDPNLLSDLGAAYRNRGELKRALSLFEKARAADPDHWPSLLNLVLCEAFDVRAAAAAGRHFQELRRRYPEIPNLDRIEKQISSLRPSG